MSIRFKFLSIIALGFLVFTTAVVLFSRSRVEEAFSSFEIKAADAAAKIIREAYTSELDALLRYGEETARSPRIKNLLENRTDEVPALFQGLNMLDNRISFIAVTNARGGIVFSREADFQNKLLKETSEELHAFIRDDNRLRTHHHTGSRVRGLIMLNAQPILAVSVPILPEREGELIRGAVILGRRWEQPDFSQVAADSGMTVFHQQADGALSADMQAFFKSSGRAVNQIRTQLLVNQSIASYLTMPDIYEKPALIVRLSRRREAYDASLTCAYQVAKFTLIVGLVLFSLAVVLVETTIIHRLRALLNQVKHLKSRERISEAVITVRGKDEVGKIAHGIRFLLDAMKTNRYRWMRAEKRLQELLEFSPMGILLAKPETHKLYRMNEAAMNMTGYAKRTLAGKKVEDVFVSIDGNTSFGELTAKMEEETQEVTGLLKCKSGGELPVSLRAGFIRQADGDLLLFAFTPLENGETSS